MERVFGETANISASVDTRALRRKLEQAIPAGGLLGGAIDRLSGSGGGGASGDAVSGAGGAGIQAAQLEKLNDIHEELEKIGASGGAGGGSGAGGVASGILSGIGIRSLLGGGGAAGGAGILSKLGGLKKLGGLRRGVPLQPGKGSKRTMAEEKKTFNRANQIREMLGMEKRKEPDWEQRRQKRKEEMPELKVPEWLKNISLETPGWLSGDLALETPDWMTGDFSLETPDWMSGDLSLNTPDWMTGDLTLQAPEWLQNLVPNTGNDSQKSNRNGSGNWIGDPTKKGPWYTGPDPFNLGPNSGSGNTTTNRAANNGASTRSGDVNAPVDVTVEQQSLDQRTKQDIVDEVLRALDNQVPSSLFR